MIRPPLKGILRWLAVMAWLVVLCIPVPVHGASIVVRKSSARPQYPTQVTFTLNAESPSKINRVILWYGFTTSTCSHPENREAVRVEAGNTINLSWDWVLYGDEFMLPGMELWWYWDIYDEAGGALTTEKQTLVLLENRYTWQQVDQGPVSLFWNSGGQDFGGGLAEIVQESLDRLLKDTGVAAPDGIRLVVYPSEKEMVRALQHVPRWAGGAALPRYNLVLVGIDPFGPDGWAESVISHELAHLIVNVRAGNCSGGAVPLWLNEGLAQYTERNVRDEGQADVMHALDNWDLPDLKSIEEHFPKTAGKALVAYSHSRMVVAYMLDTYGKEKMGQMLALFKDGKLVDEALRQVYGLDTNGIDETWRASLGFGDAPATAFPTPTLTRTPRPSATPTVTVTPTVTQTPLPPTATFTPNPTIITPANTASPQRTGWSAGRLLMVFGAGTAAACTFTVIAVAGVLFFVLRRK